MKTEKKLSVVGPLKKVSPKKRESEWNELFRAFGELRKKVAELDAHVAKLKNK